MCLNLHFKSFNIIKQFLVIEGYCTFNSRNSNISNVVIYNWSQFKLDAVANLTLCIVIQGISLCNHKIRWALNDEYFIIGKITRIKRRLPHTSIIAYLDFILKSLVLTRVLCRCVDMYAHMKYKINVWI